MYLANIVIAALVFVPDPRPSNPPMTSGGLVQFAQLKGAPRPISPTFNNVVRNRPASSKGSSAQRSSGSAKAGRVSGSSSLSRPPAKLSNGFNSAAGRRPTPPTPPRPPGGSLRGVSQPFQNAANPLLRNRSNDAARPPTARSTNAGRPRPMPRPRSGR